MAAFTVKLVFLLSLTKLTLQDITCDGIEWSGTAEAFGTPHLYTLIANNSATIQDYLQYLLGQQEENHDETKNLLQSQNKTLTRMADTQTRNTVTQTQIANSSATIQDFLQYQLEENHDETKNLLQSLIETVTRVADTQTSNAVTQTQIANSSATIQDFLQHQIKQQNINHHETKHLLQGQTETLTHMVDTQTQIAETQAQMTNAFDQVVTLLQNMSTTMNTVVSLLENQKETLENIAIQSRQSANTTALANNANSRWRNEVVEALEIQGQQLQNLTTIMSKQLQFDHHTYLQTKPRDCSQIASYGDYPPGLYEVMLSNELHNVYCDGEWTVFQRRFDGSVDFYRGWEDYQQGFGNLLTDGEFWLGLDKLHQITQSGTWVLRVDLEDFNGDTAYALYDSFHIGDAASNYRLSISSYSGTAGDSMAGSYSLNNVQFSTEDRDNDVSGINCADFRQGAWWYRDCTHSNLNGRYLGQSDNSGTGMEWYHWKNSWQSLKKSEMKIRRVQ